MTVQQFIRKAALIVGQADGNALDMSDFRFAFSIRRGDAQTPNSADIRVYNLNDQTAQSVQKEFSRVVVQGGYNGNYGVIFDGQIKQVRRGREGVDTYLDLTAADGDSAYNFAVTAVSLAASANAPGDAVSAVLQSMAQHGITQGYTPDLSVNKLARGKVIFGMSRDELRKIAANTQTSWSIQNGKVQFVPISAYLPGDIPVLNYETGVVGVPQQTQNGITLRILLNPNIKIGQAVKLNNEDVMRARIGLGVNQQIENIQTQDLYGKLNADGLYYVMVADHSGDTRGNDWYTDLTCLAIDATVPPVYASRFPVGQAYVTSVRRF